MWHPGLVDVVYATVAGALLSTAVVAARAGSPHRTPSRTALVAAVGTLGVSFLVQSPAARGVQNHLVADLGQLTGNGTSLVAAYALRVMVLHVRYDRDTAAARARRWLVALVVAFVAMTVLFLATPTVPGRFTSPDAPAGVVAYYLIFTSYLGATLVSLALLLGRYLDTAGGRWSRLSLHLHRAACVAGLIYLAGRVVALLVGRPRLEGSGQRFNLIELGVTILMPAVVAVLFLLGVLIGRGERWLRHRRAYRRLRPLWEAARAARPHAVLPVTGGGARLRLYRRIIEIQDAQLAAAQVLDAAQRRRIDGAIAGAALTGESAAAVREAALLAAGLAVLRDGRAAGGDGGPVTGAADQEVDLSAAVARLERVSAAWTGSPVVHRLAAPPEPANPR
ncbi:MAB_1171c family putative transporter [Micromonospora sp. BQ11]|uniref:MAB_1171c family putative transporter n=1 Tax=Micromonospora sp. BQ11 TaxID=3452212 RepID=UPI003F8A74C8